VAEVQTPSDTTFRVYDWDRSPARELHIDQALECMFDEGGRPKSTGKPRTLSRPLTAGRITTTSMCETDYFAIERVEAPGGTSCPIVTQELPQAWMVIQGSLEIQGGFGRSLQITRGETVLVPAAADGWKAGFLADTWLLIVMLPSPLRNMLSRFR
jgi:mannose-6-phosphate isomerase